MEDNEIIITLDVMLAKRKMTVTELSERIGVHITNLSIFKNGRGHAVKLKTLMRVCKVLNCTPNDIIKFREKSASLQEMSEETRRYYNPNNNE
jgi:putative transcriptional regulator